MNRLQTIGQVLLFAATIPFLYFVVTDAEKNWVYHASLAAILISLVIRMVDNWKRGNRKLVKNQLLIWGVLFLVGLLLVLFIQR